jgi:uncharacterized lipoprotein NlpE involved in copper resistance
MKKIIVGLLAITLCFSLVGCQKSDNNKIKNTIKGNINTYYEMSDGTWTCNDYVYKYKLEISGRIPNAAKDTTYIYLSNIEEISFEKAYMASGLSSNSNDYFSLDEAILVDMR